MITVSIVSHGHAYMLPKLLEQILAFPEVSLIVVTFNIPEELEIKNDRIFSIKNAIPKGFGANNNTAFELCNSEYFCIVNPDVIFIENPFPELIKRFLDTQIGLVAPAIVNKAGLLQDSMRHFISPFSIVRRYLFLSNKIYCFGEEKSRCEVEWVAGMFMLFKSSVYRDLRGFDEKYFLYVEDADICTRLWTRGYSLVVVPEVLVIHDARRATLKNWRHFCWHISGLIRYFLKHFGRLPKIHK